MVKANDLSNAVAQLNELLEVEGPLAKKGKINSLDVALEFAMRTISAASNAPSGKATELLPIEEGLPACPFELPPNLAGKNHCEYLGYYHTDITVPSEYFRSDVNRPDDVGPHRLDFTYLFKSGSDNPAYITMAAGRRVKATATLDPSPSVRSLEPEETTIAANPRLKQALEGRNQPIS
jgi:hypothetical protein